MTARPYVIDDDVIHAERKAVAEAVMNAAADTGWFSPDLSDVIEGATLKHRFVLSVDRSLSEFADEWRRPVWPDEPRALEDAFREYIALNPNAVAYARRWLADQRHSFRDVGGINCGECGEAFHAKCHEVRHG